MPLKGEEVLDQSLSIIVHAYNAQHTIVEHVTELLEIATDLTPEFEILVVDDGSVDQTEEVTYELTLQYPQVQLIRHETHLGMSAAIRTGMRFTSGDVVLVQDEPVRVRASEVQRLWSLGAEEDVLLARPDPLTTSPKPLDAGLLQRLMAWGAKVSQTVEERNRSGLQMIRRKAAEDSGDQLEYELERVEQPAASSGVVGGGIPTPNFTRVYRTTEST